MHEGLLKSWNHGATRQAIISFVAWVTQEGGPDYVEPSARIAVFDNNGCLWCEKPMPIQADFLLRRIAEQAEADPSLRDKQPWKSVQTASTRAGWATSSPSTMKAMTPSSNRWP